MLGFIYLFIVFVLCLRTFAKHSKYDKIAKTKNVINGTNLYFDHNMVARDLDTNHPYDVYMENGDRMIRDLKTFKTINLSQEIREKEYWKKVKDNPEGEVAVLISKPTLEKARQAGHVVGNRYKDLVTGALYVKRCYKGYCYYMDIKTRKLVYNVNNGRELTPQDKLNIEDYNKHIAKSSMDRCFAIPGER